MNGQKYILGFLIIFIFFAGCAHPKPESDSSVNKAFLSQTSERMRNIYTGDTVECPRCAGNNVVHVIEIDSDGMATVENRNNGGRGKISILSLVRLAPPQPIEICLQNLCKGNSVFVKGAVGSGERWGRVAQLFTNGTANVQGIDKGEIATYRIYRLEKRERPQSKEGQAVRYSDDALTAYKEPESDYAGNALNLSTTCIGRTKDYGNCESYCKHVGKRCLQTCTSPAGRLNQAASAWLRGSRCQGLDAGGDVPCSFNFDDQINSIPRWRCCCR